MRLTFDGDVFRLRRAPGGLFVKAYEARMFAQARHGKGSSKGGQFKGKSGGGGPSESRTELRPVAGAAGGGKAGALAGGQVEADMKSRPGTTLFGNPYGVKQADHDAMISGMRSKGGVVPAAEMVRLSSLHSGQTEVSALGIGRHARNVSRGRSRRIAVIRHKGKNFIWDGNHRAAAAWMTGKSEINAFVINLD